MIVSDETAAKPRADGPKLQGLAYETLKGRYDRRYSTARPEIVTHCSLVLAKEFASAAKELRRTQRLLAPAEVVSLEERKVLLEDAQKGRQL